jgi:uncharacterized membrane protein YebE (DUF533 family)
MVDIQRLLGGFLGNANGTETVARATDSLKSGSLPGGLLGGAAAGGLIAAVVSSKKARKFAGKTLTYGGLAVLGGLAYKAWSDHKANAPKTARPLDPQSVLEAPAGSPFDPAAVTDQRGNDFRLTLVTAMISAAMADGHVDQREHQVIREQIDGAGLAADEKSFLFDQLSKPSDPVAIANLTSGEEQAAEVYLASLAVLDRSVPDDLRYQERLGDALRLPSDLRERLEAHAREAFQG